MTPQSLILRNTRDRFTDICTAANNFLLSKISNVLFCRMLWNDCIINHKPFTFSFILKHTKNNFVLLKLHLMWDPVAPNDRLNKKIAFQNLWTISKIDFVSLFFHNDPHFLYPSSLMSSPLFFSERLSTWAGLTRRSKTQFRIGCIRQSSSLWGVPHFSSFQPLL